MELRIIACQNDCQEEESGWSSAEPNITKPNTGVGEIASPFKRKKQLVEEQVRQTSFVSFNPTNTTIETPASELEMLDAWSVTKPLLVTVCEAKQLSDNEVPDFVSSSSS